MKSVPGQVRGQLPDCDRRVVDRPEVSQVMAEAGHYLIFNHWPAVLSGVAAES